MEKDWTASQQIDLLTAVEALSHSESLKIHGLRKRRNKMMHELDEATEAEALDCLNLAISLLKLPAFDPPLKPLHVFL